MHECLSFVYKVYVLNPVRWARNSLGYNITCHDSVTWIQARCGTSTLHFSIFTKIRTKIQQSRSVRTNVSGPKSKVENYELQIDNCFPSCWAVATDATHDTETLCMPNGLQQYPGINAHCYLYHYISWGTNHLNLNGDLWSAYHNWHASTRITLASLDHVVVLINIGIVYQNLSVDHG